MFRYQTKQNEHIGTIVQPKLRIGQPDDKYELEAESVADKVMNIKQSEAIQMQPIEGTGKLMQSNSNNSDDLVSLGTDQQPSFLRGGGQSLTPRTNHFMSKAFATDFSNVQIHTNSKAVQMNEQLGARAFAHGSDIYFNNNQFNPDTSDGKHLLAHELTHVVQQKGKENGERAPEYLNEFSNQHQGDYSNSISKESLNVIRCMGRAADPIVEYPDYFGRYSIEAMDDINRITSSLSDLGPFIVISTIVTLGTSDPIETLATGSYDISPQAKALSVLPIIRNNRVRQVIELLIVMHGNDLNSQENVFWNRVLEKL